MDTIYTALVFPLLLPTGHTLVALVWCSINIAHVRE